MRTRFGIELIGTLVDIPIEAFGTGQEVEGARAAGNRASGEEHECQNSNCPAPHLDKFPRLPPWCLGRCFFGLCLGSKIRNGGFPPLGTSVPGVGSSGSAGRG